MMDKAQETIADFNPFGTKKQPLPGQRRAVFPEGVPGVQQGVPAEMMKGAQQIPDPNAPAVIEAPPETAAAEEKPKPKPQGARCAPAPGGNPRSSGAEAGSCGAPAGSACDAGAATRRRGRVASTCRGQPACAGSRVAGAGRGQSARAVNRVAVADAAAGGDNGMA